LRGRYGVLRGDGQSQQSARTEYSVKYHGILPVKVMLQNQSAGVPWVSATPTTIVMVKVAVAVILANVRTALGIK
jgi:hypothetical protein